MGSPSGLENVVGISTCTLINLSIQLALLLERPGEGLRLWESKPRNLLLLRENMVEMRRSAYNQIPS